MKRITAFLLCFVLVFSLAACDSAQTSSSSSASSMSVPTVTPESAAEPEETSASAPEPANESTPAPAAEPEGGKTLVVYYSASGNTERVANVIAATTGGDTFALIPSQPYTDADLNWRDRDSRVSREHDDESLRAIELEQSTVDNWDEYDTVYIGYPIWWGIAAWPVDTFIKTNDFTGKTVIPFCTSSSSGLGQSGQLLADMAGTGDWQEGIRFQSSVSDEDVAEWANGLELN